MDDLAYAEWDALSQEGRQRVYDAFEDDRGGVTCLARLIVDPSFETLQNWRIFRRNGGTEPSYFGSWIFWYQARDIEIVYAPVAMTRVERRFRGRGLSPTIETGEAELPADAVERLLAEMSGAALPLYAPAEHIGCDGTSYQLRLGDFSAGVQYIWWEDPPQQWAPLRKITTAFRVLINPTSARSSFKTGVGRSG